MHEPPLPGVRPFMNHAATVRGDPSSKCGSPCALHGSYTQVQPVRPWDFAPRISVPRKPRRSPPTSPGGDLGARRRPLQAEASALAADLSRRRPRRSPPTSPGGGLGARRRPLQAEASALAADLSRRRPRHKGGVGTLSARDGAQRAPRDGFMAVPTPPLCRGLRRTASVPAPRLPPHRQPASAEPSAAPPAHQRRGFRRTARPPAPRLPPHRPPASAEPSAAPPACQRRALRRTARVPAPRPPPHRRRATPMPRGAQAPGRRSLESATTVISSRTALGAHATTRGSRSKTSPL